MSRAVTGETEPTVDDITNSDFITGSVRVVLGLYIAVSGDDGLICDVSCFVEGTF